MVSLLSALPRPPCRPSSSLSTPLWCLVAAFLSAPPRRCVLPLWCLVAAFLSAPPRRCVLPRTAPLPARKSRKDVRSPNLWPLGIGTCPQKPKRRSFNLCAPRTLPPAGLGDLKEGWFGYLIISSEPCSVTVVLLKFSDRWERGEGRLAKPGAGLIQPLSRRDGHDRPG